MINNCKRCKRKKKIRAKGYCGSCYTNHGTKLVICLKCNREKNHHAKGYCANCYKKLFYYEGIKANNLKRYYGDLSLELWKEKTKECYSCGFKKIVEIHHINENNKNNSEKNLIGLCPNCHKLVHTEPFREKMIRKLDRKGMIY